MGLILIKEHLITFFASKKENNFYNVMNLISFDNRKAFLVKMELKKVFLASLFLSKLL